MDRQVQTYSEDDIEALAYADRYSSDNVETPNGMNREEGTKKKDKINSQR